MWRSSWNLVKGVPLKDCIVWTPCKAKLVQSIFNRGWEGGCFQVYVWTCLHATVQACMYVHLPHLETNKHPSTSSKTSRWNSAGNMAAASTVGLRRLSLLYLSGALMPSCICACHPGSQFIFVAGFFCQCTAIYCESCPPSGLSNCFGFGAGKIVSVLPHTHSEEPPQTLYSWLFCIPSWI